MLRSADGTSASHALLRLNSLGIGSYVVVESKVVARKRSRWQGRANVDRFVEQLEEGHSAQRLKDNVEVDIVRRFMRGSRLLDVGIGTGRVSLPLLNVGLRLTGIDASAAMIERCGRDVRSADVRLVKGELEQLPFAPEAFDTVMSIDTFVHFADWVKNLDELLRVTSMGGRIVVDVGSRDHIDAVARQRCCDPTDVEPQHRNITLVALVPFGAVLADLVPNYWISESYASRSGGMARLVSWIGADPLLFAFAEFIERRIVQQLAPSVSGRMVAVFERNASAEAYREPLAAGLTLSDERGPEAWHAEFGAHAEHAPNRAFAAAMILAAWPLRLPDVLRVLLPDRLLREVDATERGAHVDDICTDVVAAWRSADTYVAFHGVDLLDVFGTLLHSELRDRLEANE
jgi:ubiquinone/menaquinone biosynthesis C-methylase UbiE